MLIAIDHGNYAIKTPNFTFVSGLIESEVIPAIPDDVIFYNKRYYALTERRITYRRDKTKDETYFILTLFAIAKELEKAEKYDEYVDVELAVGLPPEHYGILKDRFAEYFKLNGVIQFEYNNNKYFVTITDVMVFPQAYAAVVPQSKLVLSSPRIFVVDIGGYTTDILLLHNGKPDLQFCKSLDNGIITMNNEIIGKVNVLYDMRIDDELITEVLTGKPTTLPDEIKSIIQKAAQDHTEMILGKLKEMGIDLRVIKTIFIGGGSMLLKEFILQNPQLASSVFVEEQNANAIGYKMLGEAKLAAKRKVKIES